MIEIEPDNAWTRIYYNDDSASLLYNTLNLGLKVDVPGAEYLWSYKSGEWDGKACLFEHFGRQMVTDRNSFRIRTGLLPRLVGLLEQGGNAWEGYRDHRRLFGPYTLKPTVLPLRPYQYDAIRASFNNRFSNWGWWPRGVVEVATGGGKTEIAVAMYQMNPVPTFFLVHRKDLLLQAKERFKKYSIPAGVIGDGIFNPMANLNIATMQTIRARMADPTSHHSLILNALMSDCKQVFFDECHLMASSLDKGNEFVQVADAFVNASFRWGLTATPFMRTQYDNMLLEGVTGSSLFTIKARELIDLGFLVEPKVIMKHVPGKLAVSMDWKKAKSNKARAAHWRKVEEKGVKFNEIRTNLIIDEVEAGPYPMLVLVKTTEQAKFIEALFKLRESSVRFQFLCGKNSTSERKKALVALQQKTLDVVCATTIFDLGIDLPELQKVIFASGGKSAVAQLQRVGRSIRIAHGKKQAIVIDFMDAHHPKLLEHSKIRRKTYKEQTYVVTED
jgi:superfamily II DNA or RNA helicase